MRGKFTVILCVIAVMAILYVILLVPTMQNQGHSRQIHVGPCKIGVSLTRHRGEIWLEGWTPGVKQTGWAEWK